MLSWQIINNQQFYSNAKRLRDVLSLPSEDEISKIDKLQKFISPDLCYNIQFTSGTTGKPKAARLSHFSLVNCGYDMGELCKLLCLPLEQLLLTFVTYFNQEKDKSWIKVTAAFASTILFSMGTESLSQLWIVWITERLWFCHHLILIRKILSKPLWMRSVILYTELRPVSNK